MWQLEDFWSIIKILFRNSSLLPSRFGSLSTMLFSFIRSVHHILLHLITEFKKLGVTFLFMPKCHPCPLWVDYPFRIRHAAAGTDTTLFKHVYLSFSSFFSTLHIYFVPFHFSNGQNCSFQLTMSQNCFQKVSSTFQLVGSENCSLFEFNIYFAKLMF